MKNKFTKLISVTFIVVLAVIFIASQQTDAQTKITSNESNTSNGSNATNATTTIAVVPAKPTVTVAPPVKIIQTPVAKPQAQPLIIQIPTKLIIPSIGVSTKI